MTSDFSEMNQLAIDLGNVASRVIPRVNVILRKSAADIERDAKSFAPVDTGNLRSSISSNVLGLTAEIGPTAEYGVYVEYGTSTQAPAAFVGPAFDRNAPLFERAVAIAGGESIL
jgi:HK97 gp10 family phage protein